MEDIEQNPKQPGPCIRIGPQLMEVAPRKQQTFLNEIFSSGGTCQPPCHAKQAPRVAHGNAFEFVLAGGHD